MLAWLKQPQPLPQPVTDWFPHFGKYLSFSPFNFLVSVSDLRILWLLSFAASVVPGIQKLHRPQSSAGGLVSPFFLFYSILSSVIQDTCGWSQLCGFSLVFCLDDDLSWGERPLAPTHRWPLWGWMALSVTGAYDPCYNMEYGRFKQVQVLALN